METTERPIKTWGQLAKYLGISLYEMTYDEEFTEEEYGDDTLWMCAGLEPFLIDEPELQDLTGLYLN